MAHTLPCPPTPYHAPHTPPQITHPLGEDVESVIVRLWHASGHSVERTQQGIVVLDEIDKLASKRNKHGGKDIGGSKTF